MSTRISGLSCDFDEFNKTSQLYNDALKSSGYREKIQYDRNQNQRNTSQIDAAHIDKLLLTREAYGPENCSHLTLKVLTKDTFRSKNRVRYNTLKVYHTPCI